MDRWRRVRAGQQEGVPAAGPAGGRAAGRLAVAAGSAVVAGLAAAPRVLRAVARAAAEIPRTVAVAAAPGVPPAMAMAAAVAAGSAAVAAGSAAVHQDVIVLAALAPLAAGLAAGIPVEAAAARLRRPARPRLAAPTAERAGQETTPARAGGTKPAMERVEPLELAVVPAGAAACLIGAARAGQRGRPLVAAILRPVLAAGRVRAAGLPAASGEGLEGPGLLVVAAEPTATGGTRRTRVAAATGHQTGHSARPSGGAMTARGAAGSAVTGRTARRGGPTMVLVATGRTVRVGGRRMAAVTGRTGQVAHLVPACAPTGHVTDAETASRLATRGPTTPPLPSAWTFPTASTLSN